MTDFIVVYVTASSREEAQRIADALVEERLAACANIVPGIASVYRWKGEICCDDETLLIVKSRSALFERLCARVKEVHSYEVPEVIGLPIVVGSSDYLSWLKGETTEVAG